MCSPFQFHPKPRHNLSELSDGPDGFQEGVDKQKAEQHKRNIDMKTSVDIQKVSVDDLISRYNLAELKVHAKQIGLTGVSNLNKAGLAKKIFDSANNDSN